MSDPEVDLDKSIQSHEANLKDPDFLSALRRQMFKFAVMQLSDEHLAEDAVQEALFGAFKNIDSFGRRSALKTWVFAILKHKIIDILRQRKRLVDASELANGEEGERFNLLFDTRGFWQKDQRPVDWSNPLESVNREDFWKEFDVCLNDLPETQARIFMMREFLELDSAEICKIQNIKANNLHVILYRSRMRLRKCLENRWFIEGEL